MTDITNFALESNRIRFELDDESFIAKYPEEYQFDRPYLNLAKEFALCLWANKLAFTQDEECYIEFEVDSDRLAFWKWVAHRVHLLDHYQSDTDEEPFDFNEVEVTTGSDPKSLVPRTLPEQEYDGALVSQSTGKESVASKLMLEECGVDPIRSVFIEYSSRAATHKIDTRHEFDEYFDTDSIRIWSNFNTLQSTLEEYTDNFEPVTCFWEMAYVTMELLLSVYHGLEYIMIGSQLDTGEAFPAEDYVAIQEVNQSYAFEQAYSEYLDELLGIPITHTSNIRPFTGFTCRLVVADREPEFLKYMHNCLRPNTHNRWCLKCYKCADAWVEFMACGIDPEETGLSHDVLIENPHLGADRDSWGFDFPRYERNELAWKEFGARDFFTENVSENLSEEQFQAYKEWRSRQKERVDVDDYREIRRYQGKFVEPISMVIPDEVVDDMEMPRSQYVPDRMNPELWSSYSGEWHSFR